MIGHKITTKDVFLLLFKKENNLSFKILCMIQAEGRQTKAKDYSFSNTPCQCYAFVFSLDRHFLYSLHFKEISKKE